MTRSTWAKNSKRKNQFCFIALAWLISFAISSLYSASAYSQEGRTAESANLSQQVEDVIEDRYLSTLERRISRYLDQKFDPEDYTYSITNSIARDRVDAFSRKVTGISNDAIVTSLLVTPRLDALLIKINKMSYGRLRRFMAKVDINITFNDRIKEIEWRSAIQGLTSLIAQGENPPEIITAQSDIFPVTQQEYLEKRRISEIEGKESRISKQQHEERKGEIKLRNNILQGEVDELKKDNLSLAEQINAEDVPLKLARDWPHLLKWISLGVILGSLLVLSMIMLGAGLFFSSKTMGKKVVTAAKEAGSAVKEAFAGQAIDSLTKLGLNEDIADRVREIKKAILEKTDEDMDDVEPDLLEELQKAIKELIILVERDPVTTAAQITRLIEGAEHDKVMMLFDLLGEEISQSIFGSIHEKYQRDMKRHFYLVGPKVNTSPKHLYLIVIEFRAMLTATNILVREEAEKLLNQLLLSYSNTEIANALGQMKPTRATTLLTCLHPKRVADIMKRVDINTATIWRKEIVLSVKSDVTIEIQDVSRIYEIITDPKKVKFEESVAYLKGLMSELSEVEQEDIVDGASDDPKLKAAISGLRASMEDLWAQSLDIITRLIGELDLDMLAAMLAEAPDDIRISVLSDLKGRRKELLLDEMAVLEADEKAKKLAIRSNAQARRRVLNKLADLADDGDIFLPFTRPESISNEKRAA